MQALCAIFVSRPLSPHLSVRTNRKISTQFSFGSEEMRNTHGIGADVFRSEKRAGELPRGARAPVPGSRRALVGWLVSAGEPPALEQSATFD